jgi:DNA-binding IclR family transcriptional regulator
MMPAHKRRRLLTASALPKLTEHTVTDTPAIEKDLKRARVLRVGVEKEEYRVGLNCVAVPIFDKKGRMCATISTQAPAARSSLDHLLELVPQLNRVSASITATLEN